MHQVLSMPFADVLAPWGQAAAIILAIYLFVSIVVGLAFTAALVFLFAWVHDKAELIKKLRPTVDVLNQAIVRPESVSPVGTVQERLTQAVQRVQAIELQQKLEQIQRQTQSISVRVDQQADRVAGGIIEFRARTAMAKRIVKAFFLPGLVEHDRITTRTRPALPEASADGHDRSGRDLSELQPGVATGKEQYLVEARHERRD
jgi:hypothetical protein